MNHAKRTESQPSRRGDKSEGNAGEIETRKAPLDLMLVSRMQSASPSPSFALSVTGSEQEPQTEGYGLLSESPDNIDSDDSDSEQDDLDLESTARVTTTATEDPLNEVFGTDADTWADLRQTSQRRGSKDPRIVDLALNAADLADESFDDDYDDDILGQKEENEVRDLLDAMSLPRSSGTVSSPPPFHDQVQPPTNAPATKKHIPPPLVLQPRSGDPVLPVESSPLSTQEDDAKLPYLDEKYNEAYRGDDTMFSMSSDGVGDEFGMFRRFADDKRDGGVFDGLDIGLGDYECVSCR